MAHSSSSSYCATGAIIKSAAPERPQHIGDAADYVIWRENPGCVYTPDDYNVWRANFGRTSDSGAAVVPDSSAPADSAIPEPTTFWLVSLAIVFLIEPWVQRRFIT
jgi:hypothetical protein